MWPLMGLRPELIAMKKSFPLYHHHQHYLHYRTTTALSVLPTIQRPGHQSTLIPANALSWDATGCRFHEATRMGSKDRTGLRVLEGCPGRQRAWEGA